MITQNASYAQPQTQPIGNTNNKTTNLSPTLNPIQLSLDSKHLRAAKRLQIEKDRENENANEREREREREREGERKRGLRRERKSI